MHWWKPLRDFGAFIRQHKIMVVAPILIILALMILLILLVEAPVLKPFIYALS
jgi:hypothetical protein